MVDLTSLRKLFAIFQQLLIPSFCKVIEFLILFNHEQSKLGKFKSARIWYYTKHIYSLVETKKSGSYEQWKLCKHIKTIEMNEAWLDT